MNVWIIVACTAATAGWGGLCYWRSHALGARHAVAGTLYCVCVGCAISAWVVLVTATAGPPLVRVCDALRHRVAGGGAQLPASANHAQEDERDDAPRPELALGGTPGPIASNAPRAFISSARGFGAAEFPLYLRQYAAGIFHGRTWLGENEWAFELGRVDTAGKAWVCLGTLPAGRLVRIGATAGAACPFPLPPGTTAIQIAYARLGPAGVWLPSDRRGGLCIDARWRPAGLMPARVPAGPPGSADARFLELPEGPVGEAIAAFAHDATSDAAMAGPPLQRLCDTLRGRYTYSLTATNRPGQHPLVGFLVNSRAGHCQMFASAFVLGARAIGYPARLCVGFRGGELDRSGQVVTFFTRDAHAWAEVNVRGHGWVTVDATPAAASDGGDEPRRLGRESPFAAAATPPVDDGAVAAATVAAVARMFPLRMIWMAVVLLAGCGVVMFACMRRLGRHRVVAIAPGETAVGRRLVREIEAYARRRGIPWPRARPLGEHVRLMHKAGLGDPVLAEIVRYVYATRYAGVASDAATEREFLRALRALPLRFER